MRDRAPPRNSSESGVQGVLDHCAQGSGEAVRHLLTVHGDGDALPRITLTVVSAQACHKIDMQEKKKKKRDQRNMSSPSSITTKKCLRNHLLPVRSIFDLLDLLDRSGHLFFYSEFDEFRREKGSFIKISNIIYHFAGEDGVSIPSCPGCHFRSSPSTA